MCTKNEVLPTAKKTLKRETVEMVVTDERVTPHGLMILERWCMEDPFTLMELESNPENFMRVILNQQNWANPFTYESYDWQIQNGLVHHEILEMGGPDLSCRHAMRRLNIH